jgi:hypothetical protein
METIASNGPNGHLSDDGTARATAWLTAWDSQGLHRSATAGDQAGADWLMRESAGLGAAPAVEKFALDRLDPIDAYLGFDSTRVTGVPVFDAPATESDGVAGILGPVGAETPIAMVELSPLGVYMPQELRRNTVHRGLVIVCKGARLGLGLLNAERFRQPYGAPAIHVSSGQKKWCSPPLLDVLRRVSFLRATGRRPTRAMSS